LQNTITKNYEQTTPYMYLIQDQILSNYDSRYYYDSKTPNNVKTITKLNCYI